MGRMQTQESIADPLEPSSLDSSFSVRRADIAGFPRVWGWPLHVAIGALLVLTLPLGVAFLPMAFYSFWVLLATGVQLAGAGDDLGWSLYGAFFLGILAASGLVYLLQDRIALLGNHRARRVLWEKTEHLLGSPLPPTRFFVQLKATAEQGGLMREHRDDIGWLLVYPEHLEFIGDRLRVTLPRTEVEGVQRGPDLARIGLGGSWIELTMRASETGAGRLRLLTREGSRVSETGAGARALEQHLRHWMASPALS